MDVIHLGAHGDFVRGLQAAANRRLRSRGLAGYVIKEDGQAGARTLLAVRKAAWALGAQHGTLAKMVDSKIIPIGVQQMVRNPGRRNPQQQARGKARVADMRKRRKARAKTASSVSAKRRAIVREAKQAAANYARRPGEYHYLAGGVANTVIDTPTPTSWRSDCSQFAVNVYRQAGVPCPGSGTYMYSNTLSIEGRGAKVTSHPKPGDLGLYGAHGRTHHVEVYIGEQGRMFIGHGSPPIDSLTPGLPDFYLSFID